MALKFLRNPHVAISFALATVIAAILVYSLLFRGASHPIPALLTGQTGIVPPSKGLSSAFSEIVRGNLSIALSLNPHSFRIFAFFTLQLLARALIVFVRYPSPALSRKMAHADIVFSISLFIYCFYPLIEYTLKTFALLL